MNNRVIILLATAIVLGACAKEAGSGPEEVSEHIAVNLSVSSLDTNDPMAIDQDQTFSSLAIYMYHNDATATLERAALLPSFSSVASKEILINTQAGSKSIYLIANYVGKTFNLVGGSTLTLSSTTTKAELENIVTESSGGFLPNALLMVGHKSMTITNSDNGTFTNIALRRLQARADVHIYKGANFGSNPVTLQSVTLYNQVLNSEVKFDYSATTPQMLAAPLFNVQHLSNTSLLSAYVGGTPLLPANAAARFYSYQNLVTQFSPIQTTAPYLEVKLQESGVEHTYKGYFTDNAQLTNKYSLLQNNVYQILAILDVDSKILLNVNVLPWNQTNIEYERPITANDFTFEAWGTSWGGTNGKTMYTNVGGLEDAVFQFELKAPLGAAWVATLTNGLDFAFTASTANTTTQAVSSGFTHVGSPYLIAVRSVKRWTGQSRETEFYITVEGNEIPINPLVGLQRRYEGSDTRILIRQVASYN